MILNIPEQMSEFRLQTIRYGLELELVGMRLSTKSPSWFSIVKKEFGIKSRNKLKCYHEFCEMVGFKPKAF